jgi:hypothetical protein
METNLINGYYFKSSDVKVFPSSFRGSYKVSASAPEITFDPEARLNTEANFVAPKTTLGKTAYIVKYDDKDNKKIAFVLGGYYFEILDLDKYLKELANKTIGITLRTIRLQDPVEKASTSQKDSVRETKILDSWLNTNKATSSDIILDTEIAGEYCFTGLKVLESDLNTEGADDTIKLFLSESGTLNQEALIPMLEHGAGDNTLKHGKELIAAGANQTVIGTYNKNNPSNLFEIGNGSSKENRNNALEIAATKTIINTKTTEINSTTTVKGQLTVTGKIKSAKTESSDDENTLITKSYVDQKVGGIGSGKPVGAAGKYVKSVSQTGGAVSTELKAFDSTITDNTTNAPTSGAVKTFVENELAKLTVTAADGNTTYVQKIKSTNGKIETSQGQFVTQIDAADPDPLNPPTVAALVSYIKTLTGELEKSTTTNINTANTAAKIDKAVGGNGYYIKTIGPAKDAAGKDTGKLVATAGTFENTFTAKDCSTENAPTSAAVVDFVQKAINNVWMENVVVEGGNSTGASLKSIILNATYPVGSIYMQYIDSNSGVTRIKGENDKWYYKCPIQDTLGGTWDPVPAGKFLRAATNQYSSNNTKGDHGATGGSADAVLLNHTHKVGTSGYTDAGKASISVYPGLENKVERSNTNVKCTGWFNVRAIGGGDKGQVIMDADNTVVKLGNNAHAVDHSPATIFGWGGRQSYSNHHEVRLRLEHNHTATDSGHNHKVTIGDEPVKSNTNGKKIGTDSATNANLPPFTNVYMWIRVE